MPFIGSKSEGRRGAMKVMLVGDPGEQRTQLKTVLAALAEPELEIIEGETATAANLSQNVAAPPDATLVIVNGNEEAALSFLQSQSLHSPRPSLLAVLSRALGRADEASAALGRRRDSLHAARPGRGHPRLAENKRGALAHRAPPGRCGHFRHQPGRRRRCDFAGCRPRVGARVVASTVALVDLDLQTGGLAVFLNLDPEVTIMPLVRLERKLDSIQLESALTKHQSGVYLLAAPKRIEEGELVSDITVGTVLDLIRQLFDYVIVDCGDHVDENAVAAWERSEHLFYVLNQSIAAARCAWRFIDLFERLDLTTLEPRFILNRYNPSHPLTEKAIEATLAKSIYAKIPTDDRTFESIEMKAQDLFQLAPSSPVARAMLDLAALVMPHTEPAPAPETFMSRLKSAFTTH